MTYITRFIAGTAAILTSISIFFFFFENIPSFFELLNTHPGVPNFVGGYNSVSTESNFILLESLLHIEKSINYVDI